MSAVKGHRSAIDGVLRCMQCGNEEPRRAAGLNYGLPVHCKETMAVVTPRQLQEEREFYERREEEELYMRSAGAFE